MKYLSTKEVAKSWNISQRRVSILAAEGRIEGAMLVANRWFIPEDSKKPEDARHAIKKSENSLNEKYIFPFLLACVNSKEQISSFTQEEKELYKLCMLYEAGDFQKARKIGEDLLGSCNRFIRIGALYHLPAICMYLRDFSMTEKYYVLFKAELLNAPTHVDELKLLFDALIIRSTDFDASLNLASLYDYSIQLVPFLSGNLLFSKVEKMATKEELFDISSFELLCQMIENDGYFLYTIIDHAYLGLYYGYSGNPEKERQHIKKAIDIGIEYDTLFSLSFILSFTPDSLSEILKEYPQEIKNKIYGFAKIFTDSRNEYLAFKGNKASLFDITEDEYKLMFYCLKSYSVEKMACMLNMSVSGMKKRLARLYDKLGVKNKNEIATVYLSSVFDVKD